MRLEVVIRPFIAIEKELANLGATGSGAKEKVESLGALIPDQLRRRIGYLASVRNRAAHEGTVPPDMDGYLRQCGEVLDQLRGLKRGPPEVAQPAPSAMRTPEPRPVARPIYPIRDQPPPERSSVFFPLLLVAIGLISGFIAAGSKSAAALAFLAGVSIASPEYLSETATRLFGPPPICEPDADLSRKATGG